MKAAQMNQNGGPEVIQITEVDKPVAGAGQVLVEVHAASLNPFDSKLREGLMPVSFPFTLGGDIAGIVTEVGEGVTTLTVGDNVYGSANSLAGNTGAFAEYAAAKANALATMPATLGFDEASSMPLIGVSALQALVQHLNLQSGQKLFIHGGAGQIGIVAIQLAKHIGTYVAVTATGEGIAAAKEAGADEVIDYKTADFGIALRDYDAVFDTVGGEDTIKAAYVLKKGGTLVSMVSGIDDTATAEMGITAIQQGTKITTQALDTLRELIESGVISAHVEQTYPLDEVAQAFTARENGSAKGKVVLQIKQ